MDAGTFLVPGKFVRNKMDAVQNFLWNLNPTVFYHILYILHQTRA